MFHNIASYADDTTPYATKEITLQVLKKIKELKIRQVVFLIRLQLIILKLTQRNFIFS